MILAIALVLLVVGSVLFHFLSPWYFTPIASNWGTIDDTISITFWVTGFVFVAVNLFMAYCVIRFRHRKGRRAAYEPENKKLEWWLTGVTTVGVAAMLAPGLFVWANFVDVPEDAPIVEVVGQQWHWSYRFPGKDGKLGTVRRPARQRHESVRHQSGRSERPGRRAGVEPGTASARWASRSRCCCAPRTSCTTSRCRSSASRWTWCRAWSPTSGSRPRVRATSTCSARNCAASRTSPCAARWSWRRSRRFPGLAGAAADLRPDHGAARRRRRGGQAGLYATCAACHGAQGEGNRRDECAQADRPGRLVPGAAAEALQAGRPRHAREGHVRQDDGADGGHAGRRCRHRQRRRLHRGPCRTAAPTTVKGNASDGRRLYATCGACHGADGRGIAATNAPGSRA